MSCCKQAEQAAGPHLKRCYINFKRNLQMILMQIFFGKQKAAVYSSLYLLAEKQNPGCLYFFRLEKHPLGVDIHLDLKLFKIYGDAFGLLLQQAAITVSVHSYKSRVVTEYLA